MSARSWSFAVCGGLVALISGCSTGTSSTKVTTSTSARSATTLRAFPTVATVTATTLTAVPLPPVAETFSQSPNATSPALTASARTTSRPATTARVATKPDASVHVGDTGSGVTQIQTALAARGYKVSADGRFGAQTEQAVMSFQTKNGLTPDGIVGPATWAKLKVTATSTTATKPAVTTAKATTTTRH